MSHIHDVTVLARLSQRLLHRLGVIPYRMC